jgi:hypothetical protein
VNKGDFAGFSLMLIFVGGALVTQEIFVTKLILCGMTVCCSVEFYNNRFSKE